MNNYGSPEVIRLLVEMSNDNSEEECKRDSKNTSKVEGSEDNSCENCPELNV